MPGVGGAAGTKGMTAEVATPEPAQTALQPDWWRPGRSMQEVHNSPAFVRWMVGARGSAKTATAGMEALRHGWHTSGAKVIILRKTEASQSDTTISTLNDLFTGMGDLYKDTGDSLFASWNNGKTIRIPSRKAVEAFNAVESTWTSKADRMQWLETEGNRLCSFIEFRGLPDAKQAENRLRGFECSMLILVEADLLTLTDFQMSVPCVGRRKGTDPETCDDNGFILDSCIIVETNPPSPRHWIAKIEEEWKAGEHPDYQFWHIKTLENAHNLPPGYVANLEKVYRNNPAMRSRMVDGEYAEAFDGSPCYFAFRHDRHAGEDLTWPQGAYLIRSMDFGTANATIWSAYWQKTHGKQIDEYWHCLLEQYLEGSDTERQARGIVSLTDSEFEVNGQPFWNERSICAGVLDFCDPSGDNSNFSTKATGSPVKILNTFGINPGTMLWNRGIEVGITIGNRLMEKQDAAGNFVFKIDKKNCPILYNALCGGYRYPEPGESGFGKNEPLKGLASQDFDFSHVADAFRYGFMNCMTLLRSEYEKKKPPNFASSRPRNPNPARRR